MKRLFALTLLFIIGVSARTSWTDQDFDHAIHAEEELECELCHPVTPPGNNWQAPMPDREVCLDCHDDSDLGPLDARPSSHQGDFLYDHQVHGRNTTQDCSLCHLNQESCTICHHGENVDFLTHDRNWRYFHAISYYRRTVDCFSCHDPEVSCQSCHAENGALPVSHLQPNWSMPEFHGQQAKIDLDSCINCHSGSDPVCSDCHGPLE
jgi:hypothetical protein